MWEKFKMQVFQTAFYNEREGFTTLDNILYSGAIMNAVAGILAIVFFMVAPPEEIIIKRVTGICIIVVVVFYVFFCLVTHSLDKIKEQTPYRLRSRSTKYEFLDTEIQEELCLASFYAIFTVFTSSWTYLIYSWKVLYLAIKYSLAVPFYMLPKYIIHKSFNQKKLKKRNKKEHKDIITSYDNLLDD